jgi:hypothetical protein
MKNRKFKVIKEHSDFGEVVTKGSVVYEYTGNTMGCIESGIAVSYYKNSGPFFEMPLSCLKEVDDD